MDKAKYATSDVFVHYETFPDPRKVLLVSDQRILYCSKQEMLGAWTVSRLLGGLWTTVLNCVWLFLSLFLVTGRMDVSVG